MMTYIPSSYLKEILGDKYEAYLKFTMGCIVYSSKKDLIKIEDKKKFINLVKTGLQPQDAINKVASNSELSKKTVKKYYQLGLFDDYF